MMAAAWLPVSGTFAASGWDEQACRPDASTLPGAWSEAERWAWEQICKGEVADFDDKLNTTKASGRKTDDRFEDRGRRVGADFLRTMLTSNRLRSAIPREGVRIRGALFETDVDVRDAVLAHVFEISDSRFAGKVILNRLQTPTSISFDGTTFEGKLWLDSARIGGNLNMTNARFSQGVMLKRAGIDGDIAMSRSHVEGKLNMNGAAVGGSLFMTGGTFDNVNLTTARVDGQVQMSGARFDARVTMGAMVTGGHLLMNGEAEFGEVVLRGARIGGQLSLSQSRFRKGLDGQSMTIGQDLQIQGAVFEGAADLPSIDVGGSVEVSEATVGVLNLSGARIDKDLALGARGRTVRWTNSVDSDGKIRRPAIFLWNTSVGGLVDDADSWPENLQRVLRDFTYKRITPMGGQEAGLGKLRDADWYVKWLEGEQSNSFQPYWQLAFVLTAHGEEAKAREILIAGRERQRRQLPWWSPKRWGLWAVRWTIGYGYGVGELWALVWAAVLTLIGWTIARWRGRPEPDGERPGFWYSVDTLLPGVQLSKRHENVEIGGWAKYYFHVHRLLGYFLLIVVVAGLVAATGQTGL